MVVDIDGSILEGGGQILRTSIALSVLSQVAIRIRKIRANRKNGGLAAQHLTGIRLARDLCQGELQNDALGSNDVTFIPCKIRSGTFVADTQTAGSVALLLQVALPCILFGPDKTDLTLKGGTNADFAPQIDFTENVFKPMIKKFGINFDTEIIRRGFIRGNGIIRVKVEPVQKLSPINLVEFGDIESIYGEAFVSNLPFKMACEMANAAENILKNTIKTSVSIKPVKFTDMQAFGAGSGINLFAKTTTGCYLGSSNLGRKGISTAEVGSKAAELLLESVNKKVCADQKMQDQLIIFMALADGKSRVKVGSITSHTETAIYVTELLTKAKFNIIQLDNDTNIIECEGIGQINNNIII